ncbi:hypothetical protein AAMO2058_000338900 [Amorphochlora amoebiformis]
MSIPELPESVQFHIVWDCDPSRKPQIKKVMESTSLLTILRKHQSAMDGPMYLRFNQELEIKTRMQAATGPHYTGVVGAFRDIATLEGVPRLYRGVSAVVLAALPSHAVYFGAYEFVKKALTDDKRTDNYNHGVHACAGACATIAHDAVVTPVDVVKQRLQLYGTENKGIRQVVRNIMEKEGFRAFYASYPTTLLMNIPYVAAHFVTYEFLKKNLSSLVRQTDDKSPLVHLVSGGGAGALGGLVSNPFDVIKTRIQTSALPVEMRSLAGTLRDILTHEGLSGFSKGLTARMLYFAPSAAICWTTYEGMKRFLAWSGW